MLQPERLEVLSDAIGSEIGILDKNGAGRFG